MNTEMLTNKRRRPSRISNNKQNNSKIDKEYKKEDNMFIFLGKLNKALNLIL